MVNRMEIIRLGSVPRGGRLNSLLSPLTPMELPEDKAKDVLKLLDNLEQDDDVQKVFHNLA